ncbi:MAG: glycosyltransferase [Symploca sp. SIO2D2]|nr:glycosyltransferase [Symploca sp. SIO2D2]
MLKAPVEGEVKTRLAKDIGNVAATEIYKAMAEKQVREIPEGWSVEIRVTPDDKIDSVRDWLGDRVDYEPQGGGDLGERMARAVEDAFWKGADEVILLGGDCPAITTAVLQEAELRLEETDLVIGPSLDGGYYLLGMSLGDRSLFDDVDWGSERVYGQTMDRIEQAGLDAAVLEKLEDVDDLESLKRQQEWLDAEMMGRLL